MASGKGCFSRFLKVFLVLLAVLIILLITLFFLATGAPVSYPVPKFDGGEDSVLKRIPHEFHTPGKTTPIPGKEKTLKSLKLQGFLLVEISGIEPLTS